MSTLLTQLQKYFSTTPREVMLEEWKRFEQYNDVGPKVDEFLCTYSLDRPNDFDYIYSNTSIKKTETPNFDSEFFFIFTKNN